ncbi:DUF2326 domain-containing protein [Aeromonas veronii]|uniref:DUF2326 domain-containing protein n=1 Tax=Aeromonas veronii TaxID=654 RepID=UPI0018F2718A|nr:DUF2326 domain-containing protein [Aeromonas veronii]MBJ7580673.1 DUF2326 domain-containing protein [Aeromonas veronii]
MQLISLKANKPSFKTVYFNPNGLTLIIGKSTSTHKSNTYNGVGKSLLLQIVSFCLGSNKIAAFEKYLSGWEFTLSFKVGDVPFTVTRSAENQNKIHLNNKELGQSAFNSEMEKILVDIPKDSPFLTFRTVLSRFYRTGRGSYISSLTTSKEPSFTSLVNNAFLLELDLDYVYQKRKTRKRYQELESFEKSFKKDPIIREYYAGDLDVEFEISRLTQNIKKLESDIDNYNVAENYASIQMEADILAEQLSKIRNRIYYLNTSIKNINHSISLYQDMDLNKVYSLYGEITEFFKEGSLKKLEEVTEFHKSIHTKRSERLAKELKTLSITHAEEEKRKHELQKSFDEKIKLLSKSRALDFFAAINAQLTTLKNKLSKLLDYKNISEHSQKEMAKAIKELSNQELTTIDYLAIYKSLKHPVYIGFSSLANDFYPGAPAGISIQNNEDNNQERFKISAKIQNDASDGINEVKIFCFDLNNLINSKTHRFQSVFHDSRLFSDIDPRQRAILLQRANELTKASNKQYIATMNEDQLTSLKDVLTHKEYEDILNTVRLELKDDAPTSKLLGVQIDMQYEKE